MSEVQSSIHWKNEIEILYQKTESYRSYFFDFISGSVNGAGIFNIELGREKMNMPEVVKNKLDFDTGKLGEELSRDGRFMVIREFESSITCDYPTAKQLHAWLEEKIKTYETKAGLREAPKDEMPFVKESELARPGDLADCKITSE